MSTLPPRTALDLQQEFQDTSFTTYVFVGREDDRGWENAQIIYSLVPRLRVYRAERHNLLLDEWLGGGRPAAIVFDWSGNPAVRLDRGQARDLSDVVRAILQARGGM